MADTPNYGRYTEIPYNRMTPEQQEGYRSLIETRGQLGGPSRIWVHNPRLAKAAGPPGDHFHPGGYSLSEREREIAVCIINSKWYSAHPTSAHERRGKEVGLPARKVEALISGLPTSFTEARGQVVYEMATALANSRWVPQGLYDRAVKALGHVGIADVITLMGYYTSVSMTLAFYDVPAGATGMARRARDLHSQLRPIWRCRSGIGAFGQIALSGAATGTPSRMPAVSEVCCRRGV